MLDNKYLKAQIYYARYGKKLKFKKFGFILQIIVYSAIFEVLVFKLIPLATHYMSIFTSNFLETNNIIYKKFIFTDLYFIYTSNMSLNRIYIISIAFVSAILIFIIIESKKDIFSKMFSMWFIYILLIVFLSSFYFIFFNKYYPYNINDFSLLYVEMQCGIWFMIPFIIGIPLALFSFNYSVTIQNFFIIFITLLYSFAFGAVRYAFFIIILHKFSLLWMPLMFFAFGPLMDFVYISAIFSFYISILSKSYKNSLEVWEWI